MDVKDDLLAGRPVTKAQGVTIAELCDRFMASKQKLIDSGELAQRTWDDYHESCKKIIDAFGKGAKVANLRPLDFEEMSFPHSSHRYKSVRDPRAELQLRLRDLAATRPGYGYRQLHILLKREGQ